VRDIVNIRLREVQKRIEDNGRKIILDVDDGAKDWLAAAGVSPTYGARPLAGVIQQNLLIPLSRFIIAEAIRDGETAKVTFDAPHNRIVVQPNHSIDGMELDDYESDVNGFDDIEIEPVE
jgi:ATP-dependent Clp protease ATP-binding subunit ClpB